MSEFLPYIPSALASFVSFHTLRYPNGKLGKKLPEVKIKNVQITPSIKIHFRKRTVWLHHWVNCAILLAIAIPVNNGILDATVTKGLLIGGILQGLTFKDARRIVYKRVEF